MSSSNVSGVTKYFSTAAEGFSTTLGSTISANATSVGLNSTDGLTNGAVFVGIIEPGQTGQQTFTGTVDIGGSQITGVVWVRGTNVGHAGGVTIVDYVTGAGHNMMTAGILKQHTQAGAHTGITTDTLATTGNATIGGTLGITGVLTPSAGISGAIITNANLSTSAGEIGAAWQSWSPTWANLLVGNGTLTARYIQVGKIVYFSLVLVAGSSTSVSGSVTFTLPVTARNTGSSIGMPVGEMEIEDSGVANYVGTVRIQNGSSTLGSPMVYTASGTYAGWNQFSDTVPYSSFATADTLNCRGIYEAA